MIPLSASNTTLVFGAPLGSDIHTNCIIEFSGGESTVTSEKNYIYNGTVYASGSGTEETADLTVLMYWNGFNKVRYNLVGDLATDELKQNLVDYKFPMLLQMNSNDPLVADNFTKYQATFNNCYIKGFTRPQITKDTVGYTTTVTIGVTSITELKNYV